MEIEEEATYKWELSQKNVECTKGIKANLCRPNTKVLSQFACEQCGEEHYHAKRTVRKPKNPSFLRLLCFSFLYLIIKDTSLQIHAHLL